MPPFRSPGGTNFQIVSLILIGLVLAFGSVAFAQDEKVEKEPAKQKVSGAGMYKEYCAVCHGKDGKGEGPAASALRQEPADLTTLTKRHDGKFPDSYVANVLRNGVKNPAHGDAEMPVWGPIFVSMDTDRTISYIRISALVSYIKTMQVK